MPSDPPGWYHDPKRPGIRRYWDGDHWIDVDQVIDEHPDPPAPRASGEPRLVMQRRPEEESGHETPPAAGEPESLQD